MNSRERLWFAGSPAHKTFIASTQHACSPKGCISLGNAGYGRAGRGVRVSGPRLVPLDQALSAGDLQSPTHGGLFDRE
jgi:hypothetical protein